MFIDTRIPWQVRLLRTLAVLAVAAYVLHAFIAGTNKIVEGEPDNDRPIQVELKQSEKRALSIAADKDRCWTGSDAPLAPLPGSAVVRLPSGKVVYTRNAARLDAAFDEALGVPSDRLDAVALCL